MSEPTTEAGMFYTDAQVNELEREARREAYEKVRAAIGRHKAHFHCDSCMSEVLAAIDTLMEENDGR